MKAAHKLIVITGATGTGKTTVSALLGRRYGAFCAVFGAAHRLGNSHKSGGGRPAFLRKLRYSAGLGVRKGEGS